MALKTRKSVAFSQQRLPRDVKNSLINLLPTNILLQLQNLTIYNVSTLQCLPCLERKIEPLQSFQYSLIVNRICELSWNNLSQNELTRVAWAYYFFSIQFRENLRIARRLYPEDQNLQRLECEECETDNLSPWPGVALPGETMNHDEFMRRLLLLSPVGEKEQCDLEAIEALYLNSVRAMSPEASALTIASYEDGGLECVFNAFLRATPWNGPLLEAFKYFLTEHIRFDSDPDQGHGALSRHLAPDDRIMPAWSAFYDLLVAAIPSLLTSAVSAEAALAAE